MTGHVCWKKDRIYIEEPLHVYKVHEIIVNKEKDFPILCSHLAIWSGQEYPEHVTHHPCFSVAMIDALEVTVS